MKKKERNAFIHCCVTAISLSGLANCQPVNTLEKAFKMREFSLKNSRPLKVPENR